MPWSVVATHRRAEALACASLERLGYAAYCPLHAVYVTASGRRRRQRGHVDVLPLFTRYAFVHLAAGQCWVPARYAPGVRDLIGTRNGHPPEPTPAGIVEALQADEAIRRTPSPPEAVYRPGAPAVVASGAMRGAEVAVLEVDGQRARVAMLMLGALRELWLELAALAPR